MRHSDIPIELRQIIDSEKVDFAVKAKRRYPKSYSYSFIGFSIVWLTITTIILSVFIGPLIMNGEVHFSVNDQPTSASWEYLGAMFIPGFVLGLFVVIGLFILGKGINSLFMSGGYFIGTETRLIHYYNGTIKITDWEQFTGNIEIKSSHGEGDLTFELRTGKISSSNDDQKFVPERIYLSGVSGVHGIEKKCRVRIKENDPTPANRIPEVN